MSNTTDTAPDAPIDLGAFEEIPPRVRIKEICYHGDIIVSDETGYTVPLSDIEDALNGLPALCKRARALESQVAALTAERDALAADVGRLRDALEEAIEPLVRPSLWDSAQRDGDVRKARAILAETEAGS